VKTIADKYRTTVAPIANRVVGSISLNNLLAARVMQLEAETRREQVLQMPRVKSKTASS